LKLVCEPAAIGCSGRAFFSSTFDRIQTQIFDQSLRSGGCHDSEPCGPSCCSSAAPRTTT
jgi:hypothetical protein